MRHFLTLSLFFLVSGCQWVKATSGADQVALVKPVHVDRCRKLGTTTSSVKDRVGFVARKESTVTAELITLAKNEAAKLGGDSIVAVGESVDGAQAFDIYSCQ